MEQNKPLNLIYEQYYSPLNEKVFYLYDYLCDVVIFLDFGKIKKTLRFHFYHTLIPCMLANGLEKVFLKVVEKEKYQKNKTCHFNNNVCI